MKRKERKIAFRFLNAISSLVFIISFIYCFFFGVTIAAAAGMVAALGCIFAPILIEGGDIFEVALEVAEAILHSVVDLTLGIFEAIGNIFSN